MKSKSSKYGFQNFLENLKNFFMETSIIRKNDFQFSQIAVMSIFLQIV